MNKGERVKIVRKSLNLTLEKFGERLGLKKSTLSSIETGRNNLADSVAKAICREFNVNYLWLAEGIGEMLSESPETILDDVATMYHLTESETKFLKNLLSLSGQERMAFIDAINKLSE